MTPEQLKRAEELAKQQGGLVMPAPEDPAKLRLPPREDITRYHEPQYMPPPADRIAWKTGRAVSKSTQLSQGFVAHAPDPYDPAVIAADREAMQRGQQRMQACDDIDCYRSEQGFYYTPPMPVSRGWTDVEVLHELWGQPLNNLILAYVHGLHPTKIRVSSGCLTTDACPGRVTIVYERENGVEIVRRITQEFEVLYGSGYAVESVLRHQKQGTPLPTETPRCVGDTAGLARCKF